MRRYSNRGGSSLIDHVMDVVLQAEKITVAGQINVLARTVNLMAMATVAQAKKEKNLAIN